MRPVPENSRDPSGSFRHPQKALRPIQPAYNSGPLPDPQSNHGEHAKELRHVLNQRDRLGGALLGGPSGGLLSLPPHQPCARQLYLSLRQPSSCRSASATSTTSDHPAQAAARG